VAKCKGQGKGGKGNGGKGTTKEGGGKGAGSPPYGSAQEFQPGVLALQGPRAPPI